MSYVSLLILGLMDNIRGPFYPDVLHDLSLNPTRGSVFFAAASFAALGGNFLGSFLLGRLTAHGLMNFSIIGLGLGFWLISKSLSFSSMVVFCIVFGIHFGMLNVSQNVVVQRNASLRYRRQIFNGLHGMYGLAALTAPLLATGFLTMNWSWRPSFTFIGLVAAGVGIVFLIKGWKWGQAKVSFDSENTDGEFKLYPAVLLSLALGFYVVAELALSTRFPLWVRAVHGLPPHVGNSYMALFCGGLFASRMMFSFIPFSQFSNVFVLAMSAFLGLIAFAIGLMVHPLFAALSGVFMGPFYPVIMDEMSHRFGAEASRVIGWSITCASVCIVIMHFTLGVLTDAFGVHRALWFGPISLSFCLLVLFLVSRKSEEL